MKHKLRERMLSETTDGQAIGEGTLSRRRILSGAMAGGLAALAAPTTGALAATAESTRAPHRGQVREYWIQVDAFFHNLVPSGYDQFMGMSFKPSQSSYWALGYRAYTPGWGKPLPGNAEIGANTGIPGPVMRGEVGDTIRVHFRNNDTHYRMPHSIHPHGVVYKPESDGAYRAYDPHKPGTAVPPGGTYTYEYTVAQGSVGTWVYHDHSVPMSIKKNGQESDSDDEMGTAELGAELGLFGIFALTDAQTPKADREHIVFLHDLYQDDLPMLSQDYDSFNGASYLGNTPTFQARVGERIRWRVAALGKEFHVFHIHGHRWQSNGSSVDTMLLGPSTTATFEYIEDNPGSWLYHCHVSDHMMGGMVGHYIVAK